MQIFLDGKITETENCKGPWINTIDVKLADGSIVTLDRDTTYYRVDGNDISMEWCDVYIWDGENTNHDVDESMFNEAQLIDVYIEDDVDDDYDIKISNIYFE